MTFDLERILTSKRAYHQRLVSLSMGEKLRMLDALRERALAIRGCQLPAAIVAGEADRDAAKGRNDREA